jgi:rubrerythrin
MQTRTSSEDTLLRRDLLVRGLGVVAAAAVGGVVAGELAGAAGSASADEQDIRILNFALVLERVQSGFYREALDRARPTGDLEQFVRLVGAQEREHIRYLERALGDKAEPAGAIDFGDTTKDEDAVRQTAQALEDAGTAAYIGQATNLSPAVVAKVAPILSVEGRHAAWIRDLNQVLPAPHAADKGTPAEDIVNLLKQAGIQVEGV